MSAPRRQSYQFMTPGSEPSGMDAVATERARGYRKSKTILPD